MAFHWFYNLNGCHTPYYFLTSKTKAILICNPGNPTGYLYSKEEIQKLAAIVIKHDLFFVADEVYREFIYDGDDHYSILQEENLCRLH